MALQKYELIENIETDTYDWQCRVRAQTVWKGINKETNQCWGLNVVFVDDSNNRVHAFISSKNVEMLKEHPEEGTIYILGNFKVKQYSGHETYRPVRFEKHIYFTEHTTLVKDEGVGLAIESHAFDFMALKEIEKNADDNRFLIDVVGVVQNLRPQVTTVKNNVETRRLMFDITDGRTWVNVTLFNELGDANEKTLSENMDKDLVIIISAAKIHKFEGRVNLTNFPATRVFVNDKHYSVQEIKPQFNNRPVLDISSEDEEEDEKLEYYSIATLKDLGNEFLNKIIAVQITVKRLDEKSSWYFARCAKCNIEIYLQGDRYKCSTCNRIIPHPDKRFRVLTYCGDKSGCAAIVFQDTEVRQIIHKSVFDIHAEYPEEPIIEPFPDVLKQIQHKEYTVSIQLSEDNIKNGSTVYTAVGVNNAPESCDHHSPLRKDNVEEEMSIDEGNPAAVHANKTPETGNSTTLKRRTRRNNTSIPLSEECSLPTKNAKNIKIEK